MPDDGPVTFTTPDALRAWFRTHHRTATELDLRCFRTSAADRGVTYEQALDEALCVGWIDGVRRRLDDVSFRQRFSPRKPRSVWSNVNVARVERLIREGRMTQAGLDAFAARDPDRTGIYSFERERAELTPAYLTLFRARKRAWSFYETQPPGYRRTSTHWVMSAKREETRRRRLQILIDCSARGERIPLLAREPRRER